MQLDLFNTGTNAETSGTATAEKQELERLRQELTEQNYRYYVLNAPAISDKEFDIKMHRLQDLEARYPELFDPKSPTQQVGSDLKKGNGFRQMEHRYPMLSLQNTYSPEDVQTWYARVCKELGSSPQIVAELKYDGLSISLWYKNGTLIHALTRGDGVRGDDVLQNILTIPSIPRVITHSGIPQEFELRGEVLMPWTSFERLNKEREEQEEPLFANPRNAASGTLKLQDSGEVARRGLDAYLYYLLGGQLPASTHYDNLMKVKEWGFQVSDAITCCSTLDEVLAFISHWDTARKSLPVATDGVVLKVNDLHQQQQLGFTAKCPRWAIAYKFQPEKQQSKLLAVTYQVGRTGIVTPVANMTPVQLSGTVVRRATLHNADFMQALGLHTGDTVWVEKGGEIIPKITAVVHDKRLSDAAPVEFIHVCPECGTPLVRNEEEAAWYCPNEDGCPPQIKGKIEHFVSRKAMNIDGIGRETIDQLYNAGLLRTVADLYSLTLEDLLAQDGFQSKGARNILDGIAASKSIPWSRVLFALGIRFVGETTAKKLARAFPCFEALRMASKEQLMQVEDVGPQIADSICEWMSRADHLTLIEQLRTAGVQLESAAGEHTPKTTVLEGKNIVISGTFSRFSREQLKQMVEDNGGKNVGSVSKKTSFILAGDNMGPQKLQKARELDIPLCSEDEFLRMVQS